ncbi:MAG: NAD-dependent epimerase/dehydratase family protein [Acidimicrobiales bacterium]
MKILITGGTGFVGSHAVRRLREDGHDLRLLVRTPARVAPLMEKMGVDVGDLEIVEGDITDSVSVVAAVTGCDAVVHAAAVVATDPTMEAVMEATNLAGATNVLDAAVAQGCDPIVHLSSVSAFFPFQTDVVTADHPVDGGDEAYGRTKAACERMARSHQDQGRPVVILYPSGILGPDDWNGSVNLASTVLWLEKGFPMAKRLSGSWVDVRDLAEIIAVSMTPGNGPRRYLAMGTHLTAVDHHARIEEAIGIKLRKLPTPQPVMWVWGRAGDLARRAGKDLVLTSLGYEYLFHSRPGDDSATTAATGVEFRPIVETFRDTFAWMHAAGHVTAEKVGELA